MFWTIDYDIKYTVLYQESKDKLYCQTIRDPERIDAQLLPVDGFIKCSKPGLCESFLIIYFYWAPFAPFEERIYMYPIEVIAQFNCYG